jgi:hypothetical protein
MKCKGGIDYHIYFSLNGFPFHNEEKNKEDGEVSHHSVHCRVRNLVEDWPFITLVPFHYTFREVAKCYLSVISKLYV